MFFFFKKKRESTTKKKEYGGGLLLWSSHHKDSVPEDPQEIHPGQDGHGDVVRAGSNTAGRRSSRSPGNPNAEEDVDEEHEEDDHEDHDAARIDALDEVAEEDGHKQADVDTSGGDERTLEGDAECAGFVDVTRGAVVNGSHHQHHKRNGKDNPWQSVLRREPTLHHHIFQSLKLIGVEWWLERVAQTRRGHLQCRLQATLLRQVTGLGHLFFLTHTRTHTFNTKAYSNPPFHTIIIRK